MRRALAVALLAFAATANAIPVAYKPWVSGLASPVAIADAGDGSGRLFIVEQAGRIRVARRNQLSPTPYLDIAAQVQYGGEQGLLGLAFHPRFTQNGFFYVYHNVPANNGGSDIVIERYHAQPSSDVAEPGSKVELLRIPHPSQTNHNGGALAFGPDGYLYAAVGDGGGGGDPFNAAQNLGDLRGKILRLDVDRPAPYIPPTNPFVGTPNARGEVFAYGLRNPWRFSFDRLTGDMFIADVGQGMWEEIDFLPAGTSGQNFGWHTYEGTHCYNAATCSLPGATMPILEYSHPTGFSVTGGFRYRGYRFPELSGRYVLADYSTNRLWTSAPDGQNVWTLDETTPGLTNISSFGQDIEGEIYAAGHTSGTIWQLVPPDADDDGMADAFETQYFGSATAGNPTADSDNDGIPNLQEYREGRNPLVKDNDVFGNPRLFAMQQYRDFLAREGDVLGTEYWTSQVAGGLPRYAAIDFFLRAPEYEGLVAPVVRLYFAFFLRIPDYPGLDYWIRSRRGGTPIESISEYFAQSAEFQARYGSLDNGQFVNLLYQNVLGRAADPQGFSFWKGELDSGARTRGQVMLGFSESGEYRGVMVNEVYVTMAYVGMLRRSPDQGGFNFWVNELDAGHSPAGLIDFFYNAPEYRSRFLP